MKIRLAVKTEHYEEIKSKLLSAGIEIDDNADLILSEKDQFVNYLPVKEQETNDRLKISVEDIVYIETCGRDVLVHTEEAIYQAVDRIYQLCNMLNTEEFLRVSNSVIVSKKKVRKIKPSFSMKFILTMSDGSQVDVTRSYYNIFREALGI
ncbi:MAG: LytTR family transcriptional regulator [Lachnospiraceae bacterium]|nr:LytTR family transcriptional regulator [Lachnospiraceae bacterium]